MQSKTIPHPVTCAFAWAGVMFVVALSFLFGKHLLTRLAGAQPVPPSITDDQWLSLGILLAVSFGVGFLIAWIRRHDQLT